MVFVVLNVLAAARVGCVHEGGERAVPIHERQKSQSAMEDRREQRRHCLCQSLHHHVARRCTCGQRAFRASEYALSLNLSSCVSVPSSTCTPHISIWRRGVRRVCFFFAGGWRICVVSCVRRWRLHICVRSCASGQNSSSYRSFRPNWLFHSTSFVDVPDETDTGAQPPSWPTTTPPANWASCLAVG